MGHFEVIPCAWSADLFNDLQPALDVNPWGPGTPLQVLDGCCAFEYVAGKQRALIAVRPVQRGIANRLDIAALVSTGERLHAAQFDAAITQIARKFNADTLAMTTARDHVAAVAKRTGWIQTGVLMIKPLGQTQ